MIIPIILLFVLFRYAQWMFYPEKTIVHKLSPDDVKFFKLTDDSTAPAFKQYIQKKGISISPDIVNQHSNNPLMLLKIALLKLWYLRPRPQSSGRLIPSRSAFGPSYPSGHAYQARYIASRLSELAPEHKHEFNKIADRCSQIRVKTGMHYESDINF